MGVRVLQEPPHLPIAQGVEEMSEARKCDRCGVLFEGRGHTMYVKEIGITSRWLHVGDMCPRCADKLTKWWKKPSSKKPENS